jgi:PknH-like extracellular domain
MLEEVSTSGGPFDSSGGFNRPTCSGAIYPVESRVYNPTGYTAIRQSLLQTPAGSPSNHFVDQSVALMPSIPQTAAPWPTTIRRPSHMRSAPSSAAGTWAPQLCETPCRDVHLAAGGSRHAPNVERRGRGRVVQRIPRQRIGLRRGHRAAQWRAALFKTRCSTESAGQYVENASATHRR